MGEPVAKLAISQILDEHDNKIPDFSMQSDLKDKTSTVMSLENQVRGNDF